MRRKSKVLLGHEIFFNNLGDEVKGRWLDPVFKTGKDLVGGTNADCRSYLGLLVDLDEEDREGEQLMLITEIRIGEPSFNAGINGENDKETCSC